MSYLHRSLMLLSLCSCGDLYPEGEDASAAEDVEAAIASVFSDLALSQAHRERATTPVSLTEEALAALPTGFRPIPDVMKDDDGHYTAERGCVSNCSPVGHLAVRPSVDCGSAGSLSARKAD